MSKTNRLGFFLVMLAVALAVAHVAGAADATVVPDNHFQPTNYALVYVYGREMTLTYFIGTCAYLAKVMQSRTDTWTWVRVNLYRLIISLALMWLISFGLVIVPNLAQLFGSLGFNADQGTVGIAVMVLGFIIKTTDEIANRGPGASPRT
jgi:hypothetical protein